MASKNAQIYSERFLMLYFFTFLIGKKTSINTNPSNKVKNGNIKGKNIVG